MQSAIATILVPPLALSDLVVRLPPAALSVSAPIRRFGIRTAGWLALRDPAT
jgi:hypothetical protein